MQYLYVLHVWKQKNESILYISNEVQCTFIIFSKQHCEDLKTLQVFDNAATLVFKTECSLYYLTTISMRTKCKKHRRVSK